MPKEVAPPTTKTPETPLEGKPTEAPEPKVVSKTDPAGEDTKGSRFQEMVSKLEGGLKEWQEARHKPAKAAEDAPAPAAAPAAPAPAPAKAPEPPPAEGKPKEPAPEDDDGPIPPTITSAKGAEQFRNLRKTLKAQIKAREQEILGLKKKIEDTSHVEQAKVQTVDTKELERLRAERDDLLEKIERSSLEASPRFQAKWNRTFEEIEASAKEAVGTELAEDTVALLKLPPSKVRKERLNQIVGELGAADQSALVLAFARMDHARSERDAALKDHRESLLSMQAEEMTKAREQEILSQAKKEYIIKQALDTANGFEAFQTREDDPDHNAEADEYRKEIVAFINGEIDEAHTAFLPILAAEGQYLKAKKVPALEAKVKELEEVIAEMKGAKPGLEGAKVKEGERESRKPKGFKEAFAENWKGRNLFGT